MKKHIYIFSFVIICLLLPKECQKYKPATSGPIALINGTLIDGTGAPPLIDAVIIIKNKLIKAVGNQQKIKIPEGANIIDLHGTTILPGFINAHIHRGYNEHNLKAWATDGAR